MQNTEKIIIRKETVKDHFLSETMTRRAFRNKYEPGCNEHLMVRKMRSHPDYLPEFSRVAAVGNQTVGLIMYFKAKIVTSVPEPRKKEKGCGCGLEAVMIRPENRGMGSRRIFSALSATADLYNRLPCDRFRSRS